MIIRRIIAGAIVASVGLIAFDYMIGRKARKIIKEKANQRSKEKWNELTSQFDGAEPATIVK